MTDNERNDSKKAGELDRRSVLVGTAATAAAAASLPGAAIARSEGALSAGYGGYSKNFSDKFFNDGPTVVHSVQNIKKHFGNNVAALQWGYYQKWAPDDPNDPDQWNQNHDGSGQALYDRWEAAIDEAREDLAKLPAHKADDGPDPNHPGAKARTMLEHLDRAVTIALLEKYQVNQAPPNSGIPVKVKVDWKDKKSRRHLVRTKWDPEPLGIGQFDCKRLTIAMTCPNGGWIGTALWKSYNAQQQGDIRRFTATFTVPPKPANNCDQIIFIFHGLESIPDGTNVPAILQPVLQWATETDAKGNKTSTWAVRSWYVPADYNASFDQMPKLTDETPFQNYNTQAWTRATPVNPGDVLQGVIEWIADATHGASYRSSFLNYPDTVLDAANITKLTYPVAVIEAYMPPPGGNQTPTPVPRDGLVSPVTMTDVLLTSTNGRPPPDWKVGSASTNKLKRYDVDAQVDNATEEATITFTLRLPNAKATALDMSPPWGPTDDKT
jgi:hypothetical protein